MYLDLHVHLRGTIRPSTALRLARRNNTAFTRGFLNSDGYAWSDFSSFLQAYDRVASLIHTAGDLEEVAYEHLFSVGASGTAYIELMLSPPHEDRGWIPYRDQLAAIDAAADRAHEETGVDCRVIATAVRQLGPAAAVRAAREAVATKSPRLVGFGLTGNELLFHATDFAEAFQIARSEGLRATAHLGEHLGSETIMPAVEALGLDRVGHGIRAAESEKVMEALAETGVALEVCLSSNLRLGIAPDISGHPLAILDHAGCRITLGTDDPAFFDTNPAHEYDLAAQVLNDESVAGRITRNAIEAAFCDEQVKSRLRARLQATSGGRSAGSRQTFQFEGRSSLR